MASFERNINISTVRLHSSIKGVNPRGGSAIVETENGTIVIFGGADRTHRHFQDMIVYSPRKENAVFEVVPGSGDVPTPRSGHSLVAYGNHILLYGGIDFAEEVAYNDLYLLNTETWEWSYVGEKGYEIAGRNSHSLMILSNEAEQERLLVIYGGASPEKGTFADTIYAFLPYHSHDIDIKSFFVDWQLLPSSSDPGSNPGEREMHSTTKLSDSQVMISGGRSQASAELLSDMWLLTFLPTALRSSSSVPLQWQRLSTNLSSGRCSHSGFVISSDQVISYGVLGGITAAGIASELQILTIPREIFSSSASSSEIEVGEWTNHSISPDLGTRFGQTLCGLQYSFLSHLARNSRYRPVLGAAIIESIEQSSHSDKRACLVFGGVNVDQDFNDLWLLKLS